MGSIPEGVKTRQFRHCRCEKIRRGSWNWLMVVEFDQQWFLITSYICFSFEIWVFWTCHFPTRNKSDLAMLPSSPEEHWTGQDWSERWNEHWTSAVLPSKLVKNRPVTFLWGRFQPLSSLGLYSISSDATNVSGAAWSKERVQGDGWYQLCRDCRKLLTSSLNLQINWGVFPKNLYLGPFIFSSCAMLGDCTCITTFDHFPA